MLEAELSSLGEGWLAVSFRGLPRWGLLDSRSSLMGPGPEQCSWGS